MDKPPIGWRGWLWFDNDGCTLEQKVQRAAAAYARKHGRQANVCYVNPAVLSGELQLNGLAVVPAANVLKNHFWIGIQERGETDA